MVPFKHSKDLLFLLCTCTAALADLKISEVEGPPTGKTIRIQQLERDESGPTSVRFYAPRTGLPTKTDDLIYASEGKVAQYYYRDLGQVFKTGAEGFVLTSLTLRLQPVDVEEADPANARVSIQLLKVSGESSIDENGTTAGRNPPFIKPRWSTYAHKWPRNPKKGGTRNVLIRNNLAEKQGFLADRVDHNRGDVPAAEFFDTTTFDFRIIDHKSPSLNAGVPVPGLPPVPDGKPDLGAFEFGTPLFPVGSDLSNPPK